MSTKKNKPETTYVYRLIKGVTLDVFADVTRRPKAERFKKGEILDFDIVEEDKTTFKQIQFPNGDVVYRLPKSIVERIKKSS